MPMQFGVVVGNFGTFGGEPGVDGCLQMAETAEQLGYDSVWVHDHIVMPSNVRSRYPYSESGASPFRTDQYIYDPIAVMAAIGARTSRVRIGTSVLVVPYRNPLHLAKELATVDRISHGRIILGIGAGWMAEEFEALGIGELYPHRGAVTDEWMAVCINLWTQNGPSDFEGRYVRYKGVGANPLPIQKPHIPIWVGGKTPQAWRRVARYGTGYHTITSTPAEVGEEIQRVNAEMEKAGRDPAEITVSMLGARLPTGSPQQTIDAIREYERVGMHHVVGIPAFRPWQELEAMDPHDRLQALLESLHIFANDVLPALA